MPDENLPEDENLKRLAGLLQQATLNPPTTNAPGMDAQSIMAQMNAPKQPTTAQMEQVLGAPIERWQSPPFLQRVGAAFRREPEQVLGYWQNLYGQQNVQVLPDGQLVVKAKDDKSGVNKWLVVDEEQLTPKDIDTIVGVLPEIGGSILAMRAGGKAMPKVSGLARTTRDVVAGAIGAETAGALKDVGASMWDQVPLNLSNIAADRAKMAGTDVLLGYGLAGAGKLGSKLITPMGRTLPPIQLDAREAAEWAASKGVDLKYSVGQLTGSPFFMRSEAELMRQPFSGGRFRAFSEQQVRDFQELQNIVQGLPRQATEAERGAIPSIERLVEEIRNTISGKVEPLQGVIGAARQRLVTDANQQILNRISAATIPERQVYKSKVGEAVRGEVQAALQDFEQTSRNLYEAAYSLPGGRDRILAPPGLANQARKYLAKELPSKDVIRELPGVDAYGSPVLRTVKGREVMSAFVPNEVEGFLRELASVGQTKFSLQDLVAMRHEVTNAIKVGEAVKGVQTHHLSGIRDMLTNAIKEGTDSIPDKALRGAWQKANDEYAKNVGKFHTKLISGILKPADAPGHVGDADIFKRLVSGEDKIAEIKGFLGGTSPAFGMLKRGIADSIYEPALYPGQRVLNAKKFLSDLNDLKVNNREVFDEVFGEHGDYILQQAQRMTVGQAAKLDAALLEQGLANPRADIRLRQLIDSQAALDKAYQNDILKMIGSKSAPGPGFDVNDFVTRFVQAGNPKPDQMRQFMALIADDPDLVARLRAKTSSALMAEASRNPTQYDRVAMRVDPNRVVSADRLQKLVNETPDKRKVYTEILGDEGMENLEMIAKALKPVQQFEGLYASAGNLQSSAQVANFWRGNLGRVMDKALHNWLGGFILNSKGLSAYAANNALTPERTHMLITGILASEPAMKALVADFGSGAKDAMRELKQSLDGMLYAEQAQNASTNRLSDEQLLDAMKRLRTAPTQ